MSVMERTPTSAPTPAPAAPTAPAVPAGFAEARTTLHRIAAHVLGRRRHEVTGRFGLRACPGGFATPAFGEGPETVRVAGATLVRETAAGAAYRPITGSTLRDLASFAGTDITRDFSVGNDTPDLGDVDAPLHLDPEAAAVVTGWCALGWRALDGALADLPPAAEPAVVQLWPEHFDVGTDVGLRSGHGQRVNLGASPGDGWSAEPYLYVGPWGDDRPGDPGYWNAPFGAVLRRSQVVASGDPIATGVRFLRTGLAHLDRM